MLDPHPLGQGERYATAAELRDVADLPSMPVCPGERMADGTFAPYWVRQDGSAMVVVVRAPSLAERRMIEQAIPDDKDSMGFVLETCFHCLQEPKLTRAQLADVLSTKHPQALIQISDTAWQLAELPAIIIDREVRRLAGLPPAEPAEVAEQATAEPSAKPKRTPAQRAA